MNNAFDDKKIKENPKDYHPRRPAILDLAGAAKSQSRILPVRRVGFMGCTDDDRSPESFPLPACMTSLMEALGDGYGDVTIYAHNRSYTKRLGNHKFLGASGMAFGLLWSESLDYRTMDLTMISPFDEIIRRVFAFAGYTYELIEAGEYEIDEVYRKILRAIDDGKPILMSGLFGQPESAIIAGYENLGKSLVGWSHFQNEAEVGKTENGMFRMSDWEDKWESIVITQKNVGRSLTYEEALLNGLENMRKTNVGGYLVGYAAFDKWIEMLECAEPTSEFYRYHVSILFNYAELRAWGCDFLNNAGLREAADTFMSIHDLCWKADAAAKEGEFALREKREKVVEVMREIVSLDHKAEKLIESYLRERQAL